MPFTYVGSNRDDKVSDAQCSNQGESCSDPLVQYLIATSSELKNQNCFDPMLFTEEIVWSKSQTYGQSTPCQNMFSPTSSPMSVSKSSRPRGRPRKCNELPITS